MYREENQTVQLHVDIRQPKGQDLRLKLLDELHENGFTISYSGPEVTEHTYPEDTGRLHVKAHKDLNIDPRLVENAERMAEAYRKLYEWCDKYVRSVDIEGYLTEAEEILSAAGIELPSRTDEVS